MRNHFLLSVSLICVLLMITACAPQPVSTPAATPLPNTATPPPEPSATPTPAAGACLMGEWQISPDTLQDLLVYLTSVSSLQVKEGALYLRFDGTNFTYHANGLALRSAFMDSFLDAKADVLIEGSYLVEEDTLRFTQLSAANQIYEWTIVKGDYIRPFTGTSPVVPFEIAQEGSYSCDNDSLQLTLRDNGEQVNINLLRVE